MMIFNPERIREDFPILKKDMIYADNACMSLKPKQVIEAMNKYYLEYTACAGRSAHKLAKKVETEIDIARQEVRKLINAKKQELIFLRNTTEAINLVAKTLGLEEGDEVIISDKEHNSNLIPWLKLSEVGIKVKICPSNEDNTFSLTNYEKCFTENTKIVSIGHTSNLDGTSIPAKEAVKMAHKNGALIMLDCAQAVPGKEIDVKELGADFIAFSGHKMLGPTGTGALYGRKELLEKLDTYNLGGETVDDSTYKTYEIAEIPHKFEAGLQDYAGIIGFGEAAKYLRKIGPAKIEKHEHKLNKMISEELLQNEKITLIGPTAPEKRSGIFSFNIKGMDPHHISKMLDVSKNIMTRSGRHCVHSWFNKHKIDGSARASFYIYNTEKEAQTFTEEVKKIAKF